MAKTSSITASDDGRFRFLKRSRKLAWDAARSDAACASAILLRGFRHDADLLREGDEARVVLVGEQKWILQHLGHAGVVGVFVDQLLQRRIGFGAPAIGKIGQRQLVSAPERIGHLVGGLHCCSRFPEWRSGLLLLSSIQRPIKSRNARRSATACSGPA